MIFKIKSSCRCAHTKEQDGNSLTELKRLLPKFIIKEGLPIKGAEARNNEKKSEI